MEGDFIKISKPLLPLSWIYGLVVRVRNVMFDIGLLKSRAFDVPVISVGNITVGGTGKTPHVEYLTRTLKGLFRVAVLSRGYKRKGHGFIKATEGTTVADIGDEPFQMWRKFPDITVAVDANRCHGIDQLVAADENLDVVLLDDAFQHRYVKPGINILLVDYHRLIVYDRMLPAGRLREPLDGKDRADVVIVTKCPKNLKPMEFRVITRAMNLYPYQQLFFTTIDYGEPRPLFTPSARDAPVPSLANSHVLLLTGVASPQQLHQDLKPRCLDVQLLAFGDHHQFTKKDVALINKTFESMPQPRLIVTTEKDAVRLTATEGLSDEARRAVYTQPITISFMQEQTENFNNYIIDYVRKNSRNSILVKRKDDDKSKDRNHSGDRPRTISFRNN